MSEFKCNKCGRALEPVVDDAFRADLWHWYCGCKHYTSILFESKLTAVTKERDELKVELKTTRENLTKALETIRYMDDSKV